MQIKKSQKKFPRKSSKKPQPSKVVQTQTLDASGKILGRLASEAAVLLRGKNKPSFRPYLLCGDKVIIVNAAKMRVTGNKMREKRYYRHSGYLGNLKSETLAEVWRKNPAEVLRRAIEGMLPKNKLQSQWLKNLVIYNGEKNG